ncbi:MAG: hypothetical protein J0H94_07500 [Rhizobiales bacterium]|nr:hypothetical protein [Hyphomicrobiales bacterium]
MKEGRDDRAGGTSNVLLVVSATVDPAVETAWNDWYDNEHLPEILACPHFDEGARYVSEDNGERTYITLYRLSSEEAVKTPEFAGARGWGPFVDKVRASTRLYIRVTGGGAK